MALAGLTALLALASFVVMSGASSHARAARQAVAHPRTQNAAAAVLDPADAAWGALAFVQAPLLPHGMLDRDQARWLKSLIPDGVTAGVATPFVLTGTAPEKARATLCVAQAIYYEAAKEPAEGQRAVAQTILNRLRHPDFPKSVCGVVYEGASAPGCQFSFACDGSRDRAPVEPYWGRAKQVAQAALNGYVDRAVGTATYYHADYVDPAWAPQLVKIGQFGSQLFYRYPGPLGAAQALIGRYGGGELKVSTAGPPPSVILAIRNANAPQSAPTPDTGIILASAAAAANSSGAPHIRVAGEIIYGRRIPTKDEIAQVNAAIANDRNTRIDDLTADTPSPRPSASAAAPPSE
jgi:spore germination cell wall hydrolase CwlJ-like protein